MSTPAIQVRGLGKQYRLGERENYRALRDVISGGAARAGRALMRPAASDEDERAERDHVWALRQVDFDVEPGEILGIIGHNGAGKSTLLRVLARITHPSEGEVVYRGRVGSLLEVGTGFHPELTGAENVYLSGAILGMSRREIRTRFDEIVAFAEIEPFIDTPVKRFSTGMYMRLAFAVAAHLDTEILLVDEVLAVGDARFQQKCLGALEHAAFERGRTVLFVSHNMRAIEQLCGRGLLLEQGRLVLDGQPSQAIERYLAGLSYATRPRAWIDLSDSRRSGSGEARFKALRYSSPDPGAGHRPAPARPLTIDCVIESSGRFTANHLELAITDRRGSRLTFADVSHSGDYVSLEPGLNTFRFAISALHLNPGAFAIELRLARRPRSPIDHIEHAIEFDVVDPDLAWTGRDNRRDGFVWAPTQIARIDNPPDLPTTDGGRSGLTREVDDLQASPAAPGE